jgi:hypothetical protein
MSDSPKRETHLTEIERVSPVVSLDPPHRHFRSARHASVSAGTELAPALDLRERDTGLVRACIRNRSECLAPRARSPRERLKQCVGSGTALAALAGRFHVLVQRDLLVRVDGAQVGTTAVERRLDLLLRERRPALGALALDHRVDAFALLQIH